MKRDDSLPPKTHMHTLTHTHSLYSTDTHRTSLGDGHGCSSPYATVGSSDHEDPACHGHFQVLFHKVFGGREERAPATHTDRQQSGGGYPSTAPLHRVVEGDIKPLSI